MEYYRGDIVYIQQRAGAKGCEQRGNRPAVIVSNDMNNKHSNVVEIVYLTTAHKNNLPTHATVMCEKLSTALCESVYSVAKERIIEYLGSCTNREMNDIDKCLKISLGLVDSVRVRL